MFGIGRVVLKPGNRPFESGRCTFGRRRRSVELHCWRIVSGIWQGAYMLGLVVVGAGNGLFRFHYSTPSLKLGLMYFSLYKSYGMPSLPFTSCA